jgi:hypothetical protein
MAQQSFGVCGFDGIFFGRGSGRAAAFFATGGGCSNRRQGGGGGGSGSAAMMLHRCHLYKLTSTVAEFRFMIKRR